MNTMNTMNTIMFLSEGASTVSLIKRGDVLTNYNVSLEYSYDGIDWSEWDFSSLSINSDGALYIRGYNPDGFSSLNTHFSFIIKGDKVSCSGNIMSLIDYKNLPDVIPCDYCFYGLFENCTALTTAPELPATKLTEHCYSFMFSDCSSLKITPELPAKTLADSCYTSMFYGCSSLTAKPELPATKLADYCYSWMFDGCTFLKDKK